MSSQDGKVDCIKSRLLSGQPSNQVNLVFSFLISHLPSVILHLSHRCGAQSHRAPLHHCRCSSTLREGTSPSRAADPTHQPTRSDPSAIRLPHTSFVSCLISSHKVAPYGTLSCVQGLDLNRCCYCDSGPAIWIFPAGGARRGPVGCGPTRRAIGPLMRNSTSTQPPSIWTLRAH